MIAIIKSNNKNYVTLKLLDLGDETGRVYIVLWPLPGLVCLTAVPCEADKFVIAIISYISYSTSITFVGFFFFSFCEQLACVIFNPEPQPLATDPYSYSTVSFLSQNTTI